MNICFAATDCSGNILSCQAVSSVASSVFLSLYRYNAECCCKYQAKWNLVYTRCSQMVGKAILKNRTGQLQASKKELKNSSERQLKKSTKSQRVCSRFRVYDELFIIMSCTIGSTVGGNSTTSTDRPNKTQQA